jgi:hypothetical protein
MRDQPGTGLRSKRQDCFAQMLPTDRPRTAAELELAAGLEWAVGNPVRAELLSWAAHEARCGVSA